MATLLSGCERSGPGVASPAADPSAVLMYDSEQDPSSIWGVYARDGAQTIHVRFKTAAPNDPALIELSSLTGGPMGLNLRLPTLRGTVEFEYRVNAGGEGGDQYAFYVIPIRTPMNAQTPPVEVGSDLPGDPRNGESPYRRRFVVPAADADGQWHSGRLPFDFTLMPEAEYAILAPRINEGLASTEPGSVTFRRVTVRAEFTPQFVAQAAAQFSNPSLQE